MNAADHYRATEAAIESFYSVEPQEFPNVAAEALSHGLLAVAGAIMLRGVAGYYPKAHDDLMDAVVGRTRLDRS